MRLASCFAYIRGNLYRCLHQQKVIEEFNRFAYGIITCRGEKKCLWPLTQSRVSLDLHFDLEDCKEF